MVEALTAITITTIAGAALLTSIGATVRTTTKAAHTAVAQGLAEQMMAEIAGSRFPQNSGGNSSSSTHSHQGGHHSGRTHFDDLDDYDGWSASPPQTRRGRDVGTEGRRFWRFKRLRANRRFLEHFTRRVEVERLERDGSGGWNVVHRPSDFRRVTVRVTYTDGQSRERTLADISRIFSHVPIKP